MNILVAGLQALPAYSTVDEVTGSAIFLLLMILAVALLLARRRR